jgi:Tol biopolymer transport system component
MNQIDRLERDLSAWFGDSAVPRTPAYTDDILRRTARMRQRPRWTFPERWLPASVVTLGRRTLTPLPWRTIGLLAILALLFAAALAFYVGSRPRLPAPFGLAANGLVAYAKSGDIYTVDPVSGTRRPIVTGPESDANPRFSLDGTRLVFMRATGAGGVVPVFADADGSHQVVADFEPLFWFDPESLAWSPDGRSIALVADLEGFPAIYVVDAIEGAVRTLDFDYLEVEPYWRPPDGRELLALGGTESARKLFLVSVDDGTVRELTLPAGDRSGLRPSGWTPDGMRFAFLLGDRTHVVDLATGVETVIPVAYAHLSNDGSRVVGLNGDGTVTWLCVARIAGGPCVRISASYEGNWDTGYHWSPDDEWIITTRQDGAVLLLDPDGGSQPQPSWPADGAESWQRRAP